MRVCAEHGCPELTKGTRCQEHERAKDRVRGTKAQRGYDAAYTRLRALVLAEETHCWICGFMVHREHKAPHPGSPSVDHVVRLADGGRNTRENLRLAHLGCNSGRARG